MLSCWMKRYRFRRRRFASMSITTADATLLDLPAESLRSDRVPDAEARVDRRLSGRTADGERAREVFTVKEIVQAITRAQWTRALESAEASAARLKRNVLIAAESEQSRDG